MCAPGPRDPAETQPELCLSVSCGGVGHKEPATGAGALGAADLGMAQALLEEVAINPTIEPLELTQNWETSDAWRAQAKLCMHQDPGERSSVPTRDSPRLACECPGVSSRGVGRRQPAEGSGALGAALRVWDLLKQVAIVFITSTMVWSLEKAMATHSSTLAWEIPWTEEPGGLQSMGSRRVGHD